MIKRYNANNFALNQDYVHDFISYDTLCAKYDENYNKLILYKEWNFSVTTLKFLYKFILDYCQYQEWYKLFKDSSNKRQVLQSLIDHGVVDYVN